MLLLSGRKKRIPDDAEGTTVYLTPEDQVVLRVILARRKKRRDERSSINEILVDGIWRILIQDEQITKPQIEALLRVEKQSESRVTPIRN